MQPASPARKEEMTKLMRFTRRVGTPMALAGPASPPVASVQLPKVWRVVTNQKTAPITNSQTIGM